MSDDLIRRQDAIDAVDSETVSTNPEHFKSSEKFIKFMDDVDIASFGQWQWANGFNTALVATRVQLKKLPSAQPKPQWIPCTERMPEDYEDVLVWFEYFRYGSYNRLYQTHGIGDYSSEYNSWTINHQTGWHQLRVLAWMPLPDPPKGEQE